MPFGKLPGFRPSSDFSCVQTNTPELPADFMCRHWIDSSKFV
jgi:hypothetical protein